MTSSRVLDKAGAPHAGMAQGPRGCTNFLMRQLMRRLDQHYDAELAKAGLRTTQYSMLSNVLSMQPVRPGELARAMKMQPSTLTRNLQPLIAGGWLELGAGDDARSRSVTLTPAGHAKHAEARRRWRTAQAAVQSVVGAQRLSRLHAGIAHCMAALDTTNMKRSDDDE
ncbi:MAG: MarR family winged helix-turn-helix transcriptional regulator [Burkholderiaceae bacterium]